MSRPTTRDERGNVAIIVALSAALLFAVAALVVDLGNGFVRERDVQSQADFAAFAGGVELPAAKVASNPAVQAVADYLNANQPTDSDAGACVATESCVTADDLVDGDTLDGEVYFENDGERLRVVSPKALVQFGFAGALGVSNRNVQADATVEVRSPGNLLPFFLPRNCVTGPVDLKSPTPGTAGTPKLTYDPPSGTGGTLAKIDGATPGTLAFATPVTITLAGEKFDATMAADFWHEATNDRIPVDTTQHATATRTSDTSKTDTAQLTVPDGVVNRPGYWQLRLRNASGWSKDIGRIFVDAPPVGGTGCGVAATGDFGLLDSPRNGVNQLHTAMALNIAEGIDHVFEIFPEALRPPQASDSCNGNGGTPPPGAVLDELDPSTGRTRDDVTCVDIKNGFEADVVTDGFITGVTHDGEPHRGLLDSPTLEGCDRFGQSNERTVNGVNLNNDVLSCFLTGTTTVGEVTGPVIPTSAKESVSARIFESPRFAVVPVIDYDANPPNGSYPVIRFQPVFITDETAPSSNGNSFATSTNGVTMQSTKVASITVVPIHPDALPESAPQPPGGGTIPWIGSGTKIVVMVD